MRDLTWLAQTSLMWGDEPAPEISKEAMWAYFPVIVSVLEEVRVTTDFDPLDVLSEYAGARLEAQDGSALQVKDKAGFRALHDIFRDGIAWELLSTLNAHYREFGRIPAEFCPPFPDAPLPDEEEPSPHPSRFRTVVLSFALGVAATTLGCIVI